MILAALALVTATFQPAPPTIGDPITLEFSAPVVLDASSDFEVVSTQGKRIVIRTFQPKPLVLGGVVGGNIRFQNLIIPVRSVLAPNDDLKPAPLVPPKPVPYPRAPFVAILIAALCALAAWAAVRARSRRKAEVIEPVDVRTPEERYREAVLALREDSTHPRRWAALADATRAYLAATRPAFGNDLTTTELVPLLQENERVVVDILRQGDLEKFSRRGPQPKDFSEVASQALELAS